MAYIEPSGRGSDTLVMENCTMSSMTNSLNKLARASMKTSEEMFAFHEAYQEPEIKQEVHSCGYCHGKTTNDMRGNCAACGAPRKEVQPFIPQATLYGKPITDELWSKIRKDVNLLSVPLPTSRCYR